MATQKTTLIAAYAAMLAIANVAAVKIVPLGNITVTAGILPIAVAFLLSDIITERYGSAVAYRTVRAGIFALVLTIAITQLVVILPGDSIVDEVFAASLPILLASLTTIALSQHIDIYLFESIKSRLPYRVTRNVGSTTASQLIDTAVFTLLAFSVFPLVLPGQRLTLPVIASIVAAEWVVKTALSILDTPVFYAAT